MPRCGRRVHMVSRVIPVEPFDLVVFGGTGDLARRKILPALYRRHRAGQIEPGTRIIGVARAEMDAEAYRRLAAGALEEVVGAAEGVDAAALDAFLAMVDYVTVDARGDAGWSDLAAMLTP